MKKIFGRGKQDLRGEWEIFIFIFSLLALIVTDTALVVYSKKPFFMKSFFHF